MFRLIDERRGLFVMARLLCQNVPLAPPANLTIPPLATGMLTARQRLEPHASDAVCASCHKQMDPIGFSLENFAALARPLYAWALWATVLLCFETAVFTLILAYPLAYALVRTRSPALRSFILVASVTQLCWKCPHQSGDQTGN